MSASERAYEALARLRGNPDFAVVLEWINALREKAKEELTQRPVSDIQSLQGEARAYFKVLDANANCVDILRRLKS